MDNIRETAAGLARPNRPAAPGVPVKHSISGPPPAGPGAKAPVPTSAQSLLATFEHAWTRAQAEGERRIKALSAETKPLVQAQILVNKLSLGTQLMAQTAEAVSSTVKRVQQLAGN